MKIQATNHQRAFTLFEGLVVGLLILLLVVFTSEILVPPEKTRKVRLIVCLNNLKEDGDAFYIWGNEHGGRLPMNVPVALGGVQELIATGNVAACFQLMSNELVTPKILFCPSDEMHCYASNFGNSFTHSNVSYFIGLGVTNDQPDTVLFGDANLVQNERPAPAGILNLWTNTTAWTTDRHAGRGAVLTPDGSVQVVRHLGYPASPDTFSATNRVVIP